MGSSRGLWKVKLSHLCFCIMIISICFCYLLLHVDWLTCGMRLGRHGCVKNSPVARTGLPEYQEFGMPLSMTAAFFLPSSQLSFQLQLTHLFVIYEASGANMKHETCMHVYIYMCVYYMCVHWGLVEKRALFSFNTQVAWVTGEVKPSHREVI